MYYNIKIEMLKKGLTINSMADLIGFHRNTLSRKIGGKTKMSVEDLTLIKDRCFPEISFDILAAKHVK